MMIKAIRFKETRPLPPYAPKQRVLRRVVFRQGGHIPSALETGKDVASKSAVAKFYEAWNRRDVAAALENIADDCVYEDLVFSEPFTGKKQIQEFLEEIAKYLDDDVQFVIDDMSVDPSGKIGLLWHVEVSGISMPFSRGCSFIRVNEEGKVTFTRDIVEPTIKPGHNALKLVAVLVPLIRRLGPYADPSKLKELPIASSLLWAFYGFYLWLLVFSTSIPGTPAIQTSPETVQRILHESANFFYVNLVLHAAGVNVIPAIAEHPVDEAIFNFVGAWGLMFLPVMLSDARSKKMRPPTKWGLWIGTWYLTSFFFIPYNAMRLAPSMNPDTDEREEVPSWSPAIAGIGGFMGIVSILWALFGRPEYGGLTDRLDFFVDYFHHDRVLFAFVGDVCLYSIFQAILLKETSSPFKYIPFVGLIPYLIKGDTKTAEEKKT